VRVHPHVAVDFLVFAANCCDAGGVRHASIACLRHGLVTCLAVQMPSLIASLTDTVGSGSNAAMFGLFSHACHEVDTLSLHLGALHLSVCAGEDGLGF